MKSKGIIISLVLLIIVFVVGILSFPRKDDSTVIENTKTIKNNNMISMMFETEIGSGIYEEQNQSTWPTSEYKLNESKSGCQNGSHLEWDSVNNQVVVHAEKPDLCYAYFEKVDLVRVEAENIISSGSSLSTDFVNAINDYRTTNSVSTLTENSDLNFLAAVRAVEMAFNNKFSHTRPNETNFVTVFTDYGYEIPTNVNENLAKGNANVTSVINSWNNSQTHKDIALNTSYTKVGAACYEYNNIKYWVAFFSD